MALTRVLSDLLMKGKLSTSIGIRNCSVLHRKKKGKKERYRLLSRQQILKLQHSEDNNTWNILLTGISLFAYFTVTLF